MQDGLAQVKCDLGPEAIILSAKDIKTTGKSWGNKKSMVEIIAAKERPEPRAPDSRSDASQDVLSQLDPIREEIRDLKTAVSQFAFPRAPLAPPVDRVFQEMVFQGVRGELALRLSLDAARDLERCDDSAALGRDAVIESVIQRLPPPGPISMRGSRSQQVVALVGPTGVGKTTTVAKLAAYFSLKARRSVAMLTIDSYRIAAPEQLRIYGKIMDLPVDVVENPKKMGKALERRRDMDLILIDTAGRSHRDRFRIEELRHFFDGISVAKHLVLSCHTRERELEDTVRRFGSLGLDRLIFTKLDEATTFGTILNMAFLTELPISYLTIGQKVPEDIREATPKIISHLIFSMAPPRKTEGEVTTNGGCERLQER
jgi:flagellar biosynthesis protein FlhF